LRTARSVLPYVSVWDVNVEGATDFSVSAPGTLTVPASGGAVLQVTIDASDVPPGEARAATLYLVEQTSQGKRVLHLPVTFIRE